MYKNMILEHLFTPKEMEVIAKENEISLSELKKIIRRGTAQIKLHLINNDIILDYLEHPNEKRKKEEKIINHRPLDPNDYGKLKYIRTQFPDLTFNDIANILNTSSYMIKQIADYPTATYLKAPLDDSIYQKVFLYYKKKYPERVPSQIQSSKAETV